MRKADFDYLRQSGYTGAASDMLQKFLVDQTGSSGSVPTMLFNHLRSQGYTGATSDMLSQAAESAGYSSLSALPSSVSILEQIGGFGVVRNGQLHSSGTFTRSSTATGVGSDGLLDTFAVDQPRKVYDPVTGELEGLLIEEQRTNVLLHNRDLSQSAWVKNDGPVITYDQTGLDGQASAAATVADNSTGLIAGVEQSVTIVADSATHVGMFIVGKNASPSAYPGISMQLGGGTKVEQQYTVNPANGAIVGRPSFNTGTATLIDETPDFWLFQITATNNNTNNVLKWRFFPAVNEAFSGTWDTVATGSNVIDYPQVELNTSFATSPIETGASQVTRSADDARVPIGGEFNAGEFSFVYEGTMPLSSNSGRIYEYGPSTSNRILIYRNGSNVTLLVVSGGSNVVVSSVAGPAGGDPLKVAVRIQEDNVALSVNGGAPIIDTLATIPETTVRTVGHTAGGLSYGNILAKNITEYARALSDAELQEKSTL